MKRLPQEVLGLIPRRWEHVALHSTGQSEDVTELNGDSSETRR